MRVLVRFLLRLRKGREHPKLALEDSLWIAFCRCAIHILPLSASGFLIWINYHHFYIADGLSSQNKYDKIFLALYQVASKMHESNIPPPAHNDVSDKLQCFVSRV